MYKKFIYACFIVILIFLTILVYFITAIGRVAKTNLKLWIEGFVALSIMSSDSKVRNGLEIMCTALLFIGLYVMIVLSNMIEEEIRKLECFRSDSKDTSISLTSFEMSVDMNI